MGREYNKRDDLPGLAPLGEQPGEYPGQPVGSPSWHPTMTRTPARPTIRPPAPVGWIGKALSLYDLGLYLHPSLAW